MDHHPKRRSLFALRLIVGLALLGWPRIGSAAGTWSVISLPQKPGEVISPTALTTDAAGNLYVADMSYWGTGRIQKRDTQGNWSILASTGDAVGQVNFPTALAVDAAGNLYVAEYGYREESGEGRIQKRDAQGIWSVIATAQDRGGQSLSPIGLVADAAGNLYVAERGGNGFVVQIENRDSQGNWSVIATSGGDPVQVSVSPALAVDATGSLYVWDWNNGWRIDKRDAQGNWSVIPSEDSGQFGDVTSLAVDAAGNLYASGGGRIRKRDAEGNWSVIATTGSAIGQVNPASGLIVDAASNLAITVDAAGGLYVVDWPGSDKGWRIQKRDVQGRWSAITATGLGSGEVFDPSALAVDTGGSLYIVDTGTGNGRIQKRDAQGGWSVIDATHGASALAVDAAGNLYATAGGLIQKRDAQGSWSVIATTGSAIGQVYNPQALAVDTAGDLYVAEYQRIQKRDAVGSWSVIASWYARALAVNTAGDLYVTSVHEAGTANAYSRIEKRDAQGNWSVIASAGTDLGQVNGPAALAVDAAGNLYVADHDYLNAGSRIQKRDAQGNWSVIATPGSALGQVVLDETSGLAVDTSGNLYVADTGNDRVLKYTPQP